MSFKFASTTGTSTGGGYIRRDVSGTSVPTQSFDHSAPYTIMCWVRCDKLVNTIGYPEGGYINASPVFTVGSIGTSAATTITSALNRDFLSISFEGEFLLGVFTLGATGPFEIAKTGKTIAIGEWVHVALVRESDSVLKLYVNGDLVYTLDISVASRAALGSLSTWSFRFGFGMVYYKSSSTSVSRTYGLRYFNGAIAHIKTWKVGLSATEIASEVNSISPVKTGTDLYCYLSTPTTSGTVPSSGGDLNDESGSGYNFLKSSTVIYDVNPTIARAITLVLDASLRLGGNSLRGMVRRFAGLLGFAGIANRIKAITLILTASLVFGGNILRGMVRRFTGSLVFAGSVNRIRGAILILTASLVFGGNVLRSITRRLIGSLSPSGQAVRGFTKRLTGNLGLQSVLSFVNQRLLVLAASLGFSVNARRAITRRLIGNLSFAHRIIFGRFKILASTLRLSGAATRSYAKRFTASLGLSGSPQRSIVRRLAGSLSFISESTIIKKGLILIDRTLRMGGNMRRGMFRRFTATLRFSGAFLRIRTMQLIGGLGFTHRLGRGLLRRLDGSLSFQGNFGRGLLMTFRGNLNFSGVFSYFSSKNIIVRATRLIGFWRSVIGLDGEIDE